MSDPRMVRATDPLYGPDIEELIAAVTWMATNPPSWEVGNYARRFRDALRRYYMQDQPASRYGGVG